MQFISSLWGDTLRLCNYYAPHPTSIFLYLDLSSWDDSAWTNLNLIANGDFPF